MLCIPMTGSAEIAGPEAFENLVWEQVFQDDLHGGVVQSVCVTENYIITIENMADNAEVRDIVSAYYRKDTDAVSYTHLDVYKRQVHVQDAGIST